MALQAGKLNRRVRFQRRAPGAGGRTGSWEDIVGGGLLSCSVLYLRGGETVVGERLEGRQPAIITVRASRVTVSLTNGDQAVVRGLFGAPDEVFDIGAGTLTDARDGVEILAVRHGAPSVQN